MFTLIRRLRPHTWSLATPLLFVGCGPDISLPPAQLPVTQQVITLSAITNTHVDKPSAYNMIGLAEIFTQNTSNFDFVFDLGVDSTFHLGTKGDTIAVLIPRGGVGFVADGGLQTTFIAFDSILIAPLSGYENQKPTRIRSGDHVLAASRLQQCQFGILSPRYAKMEIIDIDVAQRFAQIRVVIDPNCGYRQLSSGVPGF
jgi:hypothetical protein